MGGGFIWPPPSQTNTRIPGWVKKSIVMKAMDGHLEMLGPGQAALVPTEVGAVQASRGYGLFRPLAASRGYGLFRPLSLIVWGCLGLVGVRPV